AIDATRTRHVHPDVLEILEDFEVSAKMRGITITMKGLEDKPGAENPLAEFQKHVRERYPQTETTE
ncbi:MAG: hypothetical protein ACFB10_24025, partial [Salibacteraceae bacterium]